VGVVPTDDFLKYMRDSNYVISALVYGYLHPDDIEELSEELCPDLRRENVRKFEADPKVFGLTFLKHLAVNTNDREWFNQVCERESGVK
jgi:hypothetical protein